MTADCRDDNHIKNQFRRQSAVGNMLVRNFSFVPIEAKIQLFKSYVSTLRELPALIFRNWAHFKQIYV